MIFLNYLNLYMDPIKDMEIKSNSSYWYKTIKAKTVAILKVSLIIIGLIAILYISFYILLFIILFWGISYLFKRKI